MSSKASRGGRRPTDSGFVLDIRTLGRRPGAMRELTRQVRLDDRIGLDLIHVPAGDVVDLDLRLESVSEGVLVTGTIDADVVGECARCLESFADHIDIPITELFAYQNSTTDQTTEEDEIHRVVDDHIDLEPVVIDAIGLELPLQPLCSPDCLGLCSECGVRLAIAGSDHSHEILDPRWAGLAAKFGSESAHNDRVKQTEAEEN